jgi:hypothetical protein
VLVLNPLTHEAPRASGTKALGTFGGTCTCG